MPKNIPQVLSQGEENEYDQQMIQKYSSKFKYSFGSINEDKNITNLKFVEKLNLQELQVYFCYNLNFTRVSLNLTDLNIISCNVLKLDGLRQMQQLTKLRIFNNSTPVNVQELQYLSNLRYLDLNQSKVTDISPLKHLIDLQNLILSRNNIYDINPLQNLKNLLELELTENNVVDLSPLQDLIQLQYLQLGGNPIVHIKALKNLTELYSLNLSQTFIQDLSPIQHHQQREDQYEINNLKEPTKDQIQHSLNYLYIKYLEEILIKYENTETLFKNKIQVFNKKITKPYKGAVKNQQRFSEKLAILFKQIEVDATFEQ
ncbi:leucine-rich_repeat domain-containing protein [Hexamita inflata]|uniref:Leucine-rich_repeat domain-containing protein n=1 Tax=Hexamita inflata TaxID=28002 RepID=A0ABP1K389_9EUKA